MAKGERPQAAPSIKGIKPREKRLERIPRGKVDPVTLEEYSKAYLRERNATMQLKRQKAEVELGRTRGKLIERALVETQARYLLISLRQGILSIPSKIGHHFGGGREIQIQEIVSFLELEMRRVLGEIERLPQCVEEGWLERLEADENGEGKAH